MTKVVKENKLVTLVAVTRAHGMAGPLDVSMIAYEKKSRIAKAEAFTRRECTRVNSPARSEVIVIIIAQAVLTNAERQ